MLIKKLLSSTNKVLNRKYGNHKPFILLNTNFPIDLILSDYLLLYKYPLAIKNIAIWKEDVKPNNTHPACIATIKKIPSPFIISIL